MNETIQKNLGDKYVSTRIASQMLGVSLRTVQLWVEAGILKAWKTAGGHRKVLLSSIEEVLADRKGSLKQVRNSSNAENYQILLVEDDDGIKEMFKFFFTDWKHPIELETADDGFDGLVKLATNVPNLLITDISMPGVNGYDMLRFLEKSKQFKDMDIMVITGLTPDKVHELGPLPKKARLFYKPLSLEKLDPMISELVNKSANQAISTTIQ